jgi:hypothetical protein
MNRQQVTAALKHHRQELTEQFGVQSLALFGSTVRNQATTASDVDLVVEFVNRLRVSSCPRCRISWDNC